MSSESESQTKSANESSKSSLITVLDDDDDDDDKNSPSLNDPTSKNEKVSITSSSSSSSNKRTFLEVNNIEKYKQFLIKPLETKRLKQSDTLDRVRQFLPMLKESTNKLLEDFKSNPDKFNIENVEDENGQHIEMNLALMPTNESNSDEDSDEDEGADDDNLKNYLKLFNQGDDESDDDEDTASESNSLDEIGLGFKVDNPNDIKKLKTNGSKLNGKKGQLIKIIDSDHEKNEEEENGNLPKTSQSA
jgi:hypothetical protein